MFLLFAFGYSHQSGYRFATPASRLNLLHAIVEDGHLYIEHHGEWTPDSATFDGHCYSDKPPGTVAVALPSFLLAAVILGVFGVPLNSGTGWLATSWGACFGALAVPAALSAIALFAWMRRQCDARSALTAILGCYLGGLPQYYSGSLFSHTLCLGLLGLAIWAADLLNGSDTPSKGRMGLAGACLGLAIASEFSAGLVAVGLGVLIAWQQRRAITAFWLGAIGPLLLIPAYNVACFGNPFRLAYLLNEHFPQLRQGFVSIGAPSAKTLYDLLIMPTRGLLFWSPFVVAACIGHSLLSKRNTACLLFCLLPIVQIIVMSGRSWDWKAGFVIGPRFLSPIVPLLVLPCALAVQKWPRIGAALAAYSVLLTTFTVLVSATPSGGYNPLIEWVIPHFRKAEICPNLGQILGLSPYASIALFYAVLASGIWWLWRQARALDAASPTANHAA